MDLHGKIMNLPCDGATLDWANTREAYMYGHRDARHAAAELATAADALIAELVEALRCAFSVMHNADAKTGYCCCGAKITENSMCDGHTTVDEGLYHQHSAIDAARAALAKAGIDNPS